MGLMDKAKEAAEQAKQAASQAVDQARGQPTPPTGPPADGGLITADPGTAPVATPTGQTAVQKDQVQESIDDFMAQMK